MPYTVLPTKVKNKAACTLKMKRNFNFTRCLNNPKAKRSVSPMSIFIKHGKFRGHQVTKIFHSMFIQIHYYNYKYTYSQLTSQC